MASRPPFIASIAIVAACLAMSPVTAQVSATCTIQADQQSVVLAIKDVPAGSMICSAACDLKSIDGTDVSFGCDVDRAQAGAADTPCKQKFEDMKLASVVGQTATCTNVRPPK